MLPAQVAGPAETRRTEEVACSDRGDVVDEGLVGKSRLHRHELPRDVLLVQEETGPPCTLSTRETSIEPLWSRHRKKYAPGGRTTSSSRLVRGARVPSSPYTLPRKRP